MASRAIKAPTTPARPACRGSSTTTDGIRVDVTPTYVADQSDPDGSDTRRPEYVFSYQVRITNETSRQVRLLSRHWIIVDADGERREVKGLGVIGQQPQIAPGGSHEYTSFCPIPTPWGTMEGVYAMRFEDEGAEGDGEPRPLFDVKVARFFLVS